MLNLDDFILARGGNPEKIRESQRRRGDPPELVDEVIALWEDHRQANYEVTKIGTEINNLQKAIGLKKRAKEDAESLLKEKEQLEEKKKAQQELVAVKHDKLRFKAKQIGNYVHESVPVSQTEDDNVTVREWAPENFDQNKQAELSHHEVLLRLDGYDPERGTKLVGHRGYSLTGWGFFLNQALINYGMEFLFKKEFIPNQPPYFLNRDQMAKTAQLSQFDEELYKVTEDPNDASSDKYLIATSEQPLSCLHCNEWLQPKELPIKYAGYSTNFRKEAGSHGRDAWGIFRVHQFEKVEQFVFSEPEKSWNYFDEMISNSEEFYRSLELPYRIVAIVSGALNNAAAKKFDLEAWFPFQKEYKELVSCSNCTDYQTRELEIRYGVKKAKEAAGAKKEYVHALNATLCATERALCCILENYQTKDGIKVPDVLQKYLPGTPTVLDYVKKLPKRQPPGGGKADEALTNNQTVLPVRPANK